jgi:uncharacterized protein (DUF1501 family)
MKVNRRDFFKLMGATGVTIPAWSWIPVASAQSVQYTGKVLINIHADGGIDQSSWIDPRMDPMLNNYAMAGSGLSIGQAGNIRFAPLANNATFFDAYSRMILAINGVNSETNDHGAGQQAHATGRLDMGYPTTNELFAFKWGAGMPMPWLNRGGFNRSVGLVPPTATPNAQGLRQLLTPNVQGTNVAMKQADVNKINAARAERMKALQARGDQLPMVGSTINQYLQANDSRAMLERVAATLPTQFNAQFPDAHIALIAAQSGITSSVQLQTGGFDTHSQHENNVRGSLTRLWNMVDFIWQTAAQLNITDRLVLRVYSEFGRTALNNDNGKDHWSVGSQLIMANNVPWTNRVVGYSGPRHERMRINPKTGAPDATNGMTITPRHIHDAMRRFLDIETADPRFNLNVPAAERIDLFSPNMVTNYPSMTV